jgi:flavin reductase (DIM6/NTAB) family NADH-FMN oxidoreductase RutF/3,4-dihydroxy-2-butanone 4-phosphate synthase
MPDLVTAMTESRAELTPIGDELFRAVFGSVPTPVSVVTTTADGRPHGATVSSFCSLSLDPPLVLVSLNRASGLLRAIRRTRRFCINVLAAGQEDLALRFARRGADRFEELPWFEKHGLPVLPGCRSWLVAGVDRVIVTGDHMTVSGLVFDAHVNEATPLLYHARRFDELAGVRRGGRRPGGGHAPPVGTRGVEVAIRELSDRRPVLLFDSVRERADLVAVAEGISAEVLELLRKRGGAVVVALARARARQLALSETGRANGAGALTTVVARAAKDKRADHASLATLAALADPATRADDLASPGPLSLLVARDGGLLECLGRAEAAVDAARLAGAAPVALVAEASGPNSMPLGRSGVAEIARELSIPVVDLEELAQTRRELEWSLW